MHEIQFDTGVEAYTINGGGVLRFNPADPGLYARFMAFQQELESGTARCKALANDGAGNPQDILAAAVALDGEIKAGLGRVFGPGNDFDALLNGVNVMAPTQGGGTVLENLLEALLPLVQKSADAREKALRHKASDAATAAAKKRAARGGQ